MYEAITSRFSKKFWGVLLSLLLAVGMLGYGFGTNSAYAVDVGANPTPKVDIAVSLPSDYSGTFLEFKQELTEKLISEGMEPGSFRITDTAAKIDTSNTEGWLVYNHNTGSVNIANYFDKNQGKLTNTSCQSFSSHIYNFTEDGKTSMIFAGYPDIAAFDAMIYPAPSNARRTFSFDVNGSAVRTHTLNSTGFMMNVGRNSDGTLTGYYLRLTGASNAINNAAIYQVSNYNPTNNSVIGGTQVGSASEATNLGPVNKARFTVDLRETSVTVQKQNYDASGNLGTIETLFKGPVALVANGYNGFGPYMQNSSHGCSEFTQFSFLDLEMKYDSSAFDALKTTQYYEGAQQKYFINLAGDSNDPQIPDETDQTYADGINRMNENEIFYLSNAQDGKIVTDTVKDAEGNITHQGLGTNNGYIAMSDDYVGEMARYIYTSFIEGKKFDQAPIASPMPLANFYMCDASTKNSENPTQIMTIHQQHLVNTDTTFAVNIADKSRVGQAAGTGSDARIAQWRFRVLDPDNNQQADSGWVDSVSKIPDFIFNKDSKHGKWIFELTVKDQLGNESKASQTYITAFLDNQKPEITGTNTSKNTARFTFTDTGQGIDEDGITFIEDNRGSGVAAYWITNDINAEPDEDDWIYFDEVQHSNYVDYDLDDTKPIIVWVKDECGNLGPETMFQPTRVQVQDPDGKPIEDYIVIGDKPIIVLPDDPDDPEDSDEKFSGWTTPEGTPVTPGTDVPVPDDHTIIIRPSFAKDYANLVYLANGGVIEEGSTATTSTFRVVSGNSIKQKIEDQNVYPVREGYSFTGWKLISGQTNAEVDALVDKTTGVSSAPAGKLIDPSDQTATLVKIDPNDETAPTPEANIKLNNYYLVAQWQIGKYKVSLDPNGGSNHGVNSFENIDYNANVGALSFPLTGRQIPTKPGYIFQGWSVDKNNNTANMFKVASGISATPVAAPLMPSRDLTVYAVWKEDPNKFVVHFDSDGGSRHNDQDYKTSTATVYQSLPSAQKPGYNFNGWYFVNKDGSLGAQINSGDTLKLKEEHTLKAQWTPRDDTKYTVDYYVNSGNKDANGNYIYTKVNSLDNGSNPTKTYTGTTEATATVPDSDKLAELTTGKKTYWYNPESSHVATVDDVQTVVNNNVLSGAITGSPNLSLKLYYDRYFDVNVKPEGDGEGTVQEALKQKEGSTPTVSWKANEGSHVARVVVDNVVRDDLINAGSYTVANPLEDNVIVRVLFEKDKADQPGGDDPNPVNPPTPPVTDNTYFQINTSVEGTNNPQYLNLTSSHSVKNKQPSIVSWNLDTQKAPYTIESITVDGVSQNIKNIGEVQFDEVTGNHNVVIKVKELASLGGIDVVTDDKYTVTVNRYGGDSNVTTSRTQLVTKGEDAKVTWNATQSDYKIAKVVVDGEALVLTEKNLQNGNCNKSLKNINSNHVVDIYMVLPEKDDEGEEVVPEIPDYTKKDEFVTITTKLVGAEGDIKGSITAGAIVKKDENADYPVDWQLESSNVSDENNALAGLVKGDDGYYYHANGKNDGYVCYELEKVMVNGQEVPKEQVLTDNGTIKVATDANKDIEVVVKPVRHTVTITKYGQGSVSPTKSVYHLDDYTNLGATPDSGWILTKVDIDGNEIFKYGFIDEAAGAMQALVDKATGEAEKNAEAQKPQAESQDQATTSTDETADNAVTSTEEPADEATETQAEVKAIDQDATETAEPQTDTVLDEPKTGDESTQMNLEPVHFLFNLFKFGSITEPAFAEGESSFDQSKLDQTNIVKDHQIDVYFTKQATNDDGTPKTDPTDPTKPIAEPIPTTLYSVSAKIVAGEGSIDGNAKVEPNGNAKIKVTPANGYEPSSVTDAEGNTYTPNENGEIDLTNVNKNIELYVSFKRTPADNNDPIKGNVDPVPQFKITATVQGGPGSINGSGTVDQGTDRTVTWKAAEDTEKVAYVFVDGVALTGDELAQAIKDGSFTFDDVTKDHMITVVFDTNINNIDTDGDGDPDINKDTDGDGTPDVDIDTDGDGKPDVNIVDKDGDGKPDPVDPKKEDPTNPTKPDVNIDTDDDDIPDVNIDITDDGKPDVNVDTDGDGDPDVNIVDKDGDGKPDPVDPKKEDPKNPTKPDVNVVIDPETGEPVYN
ncbi:MAG: InlB B-repeat-containing protein, partial [Eggerthellaceae bacterium]|nr:InlB B-repeat-containing protein [Eggerthellaceae bacterium]